jgi:hypothetical protein
MQGGLGGNDSQKDYTVGARNVVPRRHLSLDPPPEIPRSCRLSLKLFRKPFAMSAVPFLEIRK